MIMLVAVWIAWRFVCVIVPFAIAVVLATALLFGSRTSSTAAGLRHATEPVERSIEKTFRQFFKP